MSQNAIEFCVWEQIREHGQASWWRCVCISDIDECALYNGNCSEFADCTNFPGGYDCTCM